jgi:hypothetical protein
MYGTVIWPVVLYCIKENYLQSNSKVFIFNGYEIVTDMF